MKVMCINEYGWMNARSQDHANGPEYLEELTVSDSYRCDGIWFYEFKKYADEGYDQREFVVLSNIDERKLVNLEHA